MKSKKIVNIILILPFLICLSEFFMRSPKFSMKARDFKKFFENESLVMRGIKSVTFKYFVQISPYKISTICPGTNNFAFYCTIVDGNPVSNAFYDKVSTPRKILKDTILNRIEGQKNIYYLDIPSKMRMYSDYWPLSVGVEKQYLISNIAEELYSARPIKYYSIKKNESVLNNHMSDYIYYYKDTHWTPIGAYHLIESLNLDFFKKIEFQKTETFGGDIVSIANNLVGGTLEASDKRVVNGDDQVKVENLHDLQFRTFTNSGVQKNNILIIGDSFRESFSEAMAPMVHHIDEYHRSFFEEQTIDYSKYDYIFVLRTERYMPDSVL